jgi:hypothetical protein
MLEKLFIALFGVGIMTAVYKIALLIKWNIDVGLDWDLLLEIIVLFILSFLFL